jgi:YgiT-type zinc finger domain-containing protein
VTDVKPCEVCHIGSMHLLQATYTTWCQGQFVVVPGIDAWHCDVCGEFWHEPELVARIEVLLLGSKPGTASIGHHHHTQSEQPLQSAPSPNRSRSA